MKPVNTRTGKAYGNQLGYTLFYAFIRVGGVRLAYAALALVLPYYLLFRPSAVGSLMPYLRRRFPGEGRVRLWLRGCWHLFRFSQGLVDQAAAGVLGPGRLKVNFPDERRLYALSAGERGLVVVTTHAGAWLSAMGSLSHMAKPVHLLMDREFLSGNHFFELAGIADRYRFISPRGVMGGLVEAVQTLSQGGCISIMGDRTLGPGRELPHPFLGDPAPFPASPWYLASASGAEVVVLLARRTGPMSLAIEFRQVSEGLDLRGLPRGEAQALLLGRYAATLEDFLGREPQAWFNFYDFWAPRARDPHEGAENPNTNPNR